MTVRALKNLKFKTRRGIIEIRAGQVFKPAEPEKLINAGYAEPVTQETFKKIFGKLSEHLRQRDYDP